MKTLRASLASSLVPLVGVAAVGLGLGIRSAAELGGFVLIWAMFICPLTVVLVLVALAFNRRRGPCSALQFALGGLVVGTVIAGAWIEPWASNAPLLFSAIVGAGAGAVGAVTAATAWYLAVHERTV